MNSSKNQFKRAVIYVRVSTERQAEKVSPEAQEADARTYCDAHAYIIVDVYRDIEKYRVGNRMVEPSGTRADRPQLKKMLSEGYAGNFDVIIAWREDRLYRSYRPMVDVLDCLEKTGIDIELVKETFDKKLAPIKAWAAKMEIDARRERTAMGIAGRVGDGKIIAICSSPPYGYDYDEKNGILVINEEEAEWVRKIWSWWGEGIAATEIRRRLITAGAPQKGLKKRRHVWHGMVIRKILKRDAYYNGLYHVSYEGQSYELNFPPILDAETYQAVKEQKVYWKQYRPGKKKQTDLNGQLVYKPYALAAGLTFCATCNVRMGEVRTQKKTGRVYTYYRCNNYQHGYIQDGCARAVKMAETDIKIWNKVWEFIAEQSAFERAIETKIANLQAEELDAGEECSRLEQELNELFLERQKYIKWAGKEIISENDLQLQLLTLNVQETALKREITDLRLLAGNRAGWLLQLANLYRERVRIGQEAVNAEPNTPEQVKAKFEARRKIIQGLVKRVKITEDGEVEIDIEISIQDEVFSKDTLFSPNVIRQRRLTGSTG